MPQAKQYPVGRRITGVRRLTDVEMEEMYLDDDPASCLVLVLDDGSVLFPSPDTEGNGLGVMFGIDGDGKSFTLMPGGA